MQLKVKSNKDHFAEGKMKLIFLQNPESLTSAFNYFNVFSLHIICILSLCQMADCGGLPQVVQVSLVPSLVHIKHLHPYCYIYKCMQNVIWK